MANREDNFIVTAILTWNGKTLNMGTFDSISGGESDSESTKYARGGLADEEPLGGRKTVGDVTIGRLYDTYMQNNEAWIDDATGKGTLTITKQPIDDDGNSFGPKRVYTGKLITMTPPDHDSMSSDAARIELVCSPKGSIGS